MMKKRSNARSAGFGLIELMIVIALSAPILIRLFKVSIDQIYTAQAKTLAEQVRQVGGATERYITNNVSTLSAVDHKDLTIADLQPTFLDPNVKATTILGVGYKIRIRRNGAAAPYRFDALVITDGPIQQGGETRFDSLGAALQTIGASLGITYDAIDVSGVGGIVLAKLNGSGFGAWPYAPAFTPTPAGGHLAYYVGGTNNFDNTYLRTDGSNKMRGDIDFVTGGMTNADRINAQGDITTTAGNIVASSTAVGQGAVTAQGDLTSSAGNVIASSTDSGKGQVTVQNDVKISSLKTRSYGATFTDSLLALMPKNAEMATVVVSDASTVAVPTCQGGSSPAIYIVPQNAIGNVDAATWGYNMYATTSGSTWTVHMVMQDGVTPLPYARDPSTGVSGPQQAIARVFCQA